MVTHTHSHHLPHFRSRAAGTVVDYKQRSPYRHPAETPLIIRGRSSWGATIAPSLLRRHDGCWLVTADV